MAKRRRKKNPTAGEVLPWLIGGAAVIGLGYVLWQNSQPAPQYAALPTGANPSASDQLLNVATSTASAYAQCLKNGGNAGDCAKQLL